MSQCRILVDSNAYFRLAQSIHPLLNVEFGDKRYCLYCLKELQDEYDKNPRLINTFSWVNEQEYMKNRSHSLKITREEKLEIKRAYEFIYDYVRYVHPGVSKIDVLCLAHAEQLKIQVVTDDEEMRIAAKAYNIKAIKTLELLKIMLNCGYIDIMKIREIAAYWIYLNDRPKDFSLDYRKFFNEMPPK